MCNFQITSYSESDKKVLTDTWNGRTSPLNDPPGSLSTPSGSPYCSCFGHMTCKRRTPPWPKTLKRSPKHTPAHMGLHKVTKVHLKKEWNKRKSGPLPASQHCLPAHCGVSPLKGTPSVCVNPRQRGTQWVINIILLRIVWHSLSQPCTRGLSLTDRMADKRGVGGGGGGWSVTEKWGDVEGWKNARRGKNGGGTDN